MRGLELSRNYYEQIGKPMLESEFAEYLPRIAAGIAGEGSECLGFDDEISEDHDFGPGFCLWLTREDYAAVGQKLAEAYAALPGAFMGYPARAVSAQGGNRVGVMEISEFYSRFIGKEQPPHDLMRWLYLPEEKLAAAVSGEVFTDPLGEFSAVRRALLAYYPEDVRRKKIAARAVLMAQSGQYNYGRCMRRRETVAANLAMAEFIRAALSMIYLLNRKYAPYYKWMFHGLTNQDLLAETLPLLRELAETSCQAWAWKEPHPAKWDPYMNRLDRKVDLVEEICALVAEELRAQNLSSRYDDFLEVHGWEVMDRIQDPEIRRCHILMG